MDDRALDDAAELADKLRNARAARLAFARLLVRRWQRRVERKLVAERVCAQLRAVQNAASWPSVDERRRHGLFIEAKIVVNILLVGARRRVASSDAALALKLRRCGLWPSRRRLACRVGGSLIGALQAGRWLNNLQAVGGASDPTQLAKTTKRRAIGSSRRRSTSKRTRADCGRTRRERSQCSDTRWQLQPSLKLASHKTAARHTRASCEKSTHVVAVDVDYHAIFRAVAIARCRRRRRLLAATIRAALATVAARAAASRRATRRRLWCGRRRRVLVATRLKAQTNRLDATGSQPLVIDRRKRVGFGALGSAAISRACRQRRVGEQLMCGGAFYVARWRHDRARDRLWHWLSLIVASHGRHLKFFDNAVERGRRLLELAAVVRAS